MCSSGLDLKEIVETAKYDPMSIGEQVLRSLGYSINSFGYGYNSTRVVVKAPSGETVCEYSIGD